MKQKQIIAILIAVGLVIIGAGVWWQFGAQKKTVSGLNKEPLTIALNVWPGYSYVFIAQEKGFFEKNGVRVNLILKTDYNEAQKLYENGGADGIFEVFTDTVAHNIKGLPTKAVYVTDYSNEGDVIIGKNSLNSLSDLKGKRVGVDGFNSFSHLFVATALDLAGVRSSQVTFVDIPALSALGALEEGRIDAGHTWEPTKSQALDAGYKQLAKAGDMPGLITDVLAFKLSIIEERQEDILAIIKSVLEARDFITDNRAEAIAIMAKAESMGETEMDLGISGIHLLDWRDNYTAFTYAPGFESLYGTTRRIGNFMKTQGLIKTDLDSTKFIDPQFIRALK